MKLRAVMSDESLTSQHRNISNKHLNAKISLMTSTNCRVTNDFINQPGPRRSLILCIADPLVIVCSRAASYQEKNNTIRIRQELIS